MKLSLSEEAYTREFYKAYNTYGNNIPDAEWQRLSELRAICGINMGRVREIINAVQEGTIVPAIMMSTLNLIVNQVMIQSL